MKMKVSKGWHGFQMMYATESNYSEAFVHIWFPELARPSLSIHSSSKHPIVITTQVLCKALAYVTDSRWSQRPHSEPWKLSLCMEFNQNLRISSIVGPTYLMGDYVQIPVLGSLGETPKRGLSSRQWKINNRWSGFCSKSESPENWMWIYFRVISIPDFNVCVCACMHTPVCHVTCVGVRGHLMGIGSVFPVCRS